MLTFNTKYEPKKTIITTYKVEPKNKITTTIINNKNNLVIINGMVMSRAEALQYLNGVYA